MTSSLEGSPAPVRGGRLPDFFLVGHPKCGTTALYETLRAHPQVFMPELKEPSFFAREIPRDAHRMRLPSTIEQYRSLFAPAVSGQRVGEASATYLWSPSAAAAIARAAPEARAVAILREPAALLRSLHLQNLRSTYESERGLAAALELEADRRCGRRIPRGCLRPQALLYSQYVRFTEQLRRYHDALSRERVLVLIYDDFRADNEAVVRRVLRFLEVDDSVDVRVREANPTVRVRSRRLDELVHAVASGRGPLGGAARASIKRVAPRGVRRGALAAVRRRAVNGAPPPADERLMLELRRRFRGEVQAVSEYLGRDLVSLWAYDGLD